MKRIMKDHHKVDRAHMVKECCTNVVKMSKKSEKTPTQLVVPHLIIK